MASLDSKSMFKALRTNMADIVSGLTKPTVGKITTIMYGKESFTMEEMQSIKDNSKALVETVLMKENTPPDERLKVISDFVSALETAEAKKWAGTIQKAGLSSSGDMTSRTTLNSDEVDASAALVSSYEQLKYEHPADHYGRAVIIYLEIYGNGSKVPGNKVDGEALEKFFKERRFNTTVIANEDATKECITAHLNAVAMQRHAETAMFVCAILSHGGRTTDNKDCVETYNDKESLLIEEITAPFKKARGLAGKPKVFIINACRGDKVDQLHALGGGGNDTEQSGVTIGRYVPFESDFLLFYSSVEGLVSSTSTDGSHFVLTMLSTLRKNKGLDVVAAFTSVIRQLTERAPGPININNTSVPDFVQTPCIVSTLTRALHFI